MVRGGGAGTAKWVREWKQIVVGRGGVVDFREWELMMVGGICLWWWGRDGISSGRRETVVDGGEVLEQLWWEKSHHWWWGRGWIGGVGEEPPLTMGQSLVENNSMSAVRSNFYRRF
jgi:hypothetical protein